MEGGDQELTPRPAVHEEKIFVSVRLRPLNERERMKFDVSDWECINDTSILYKNADLSVSERSMYPTVYTFDRVFRGDCSTKKVYEEGAKEVALSVVNGINSTVFAYGQTSSGKTYTMTGITEYTISDIYDYVQKHNEREFVLKFSAMEIYNECVRDLLGMDNTPLRLLDDPERGTIVEKLTEEVLRDWNHVMDLLSICEAQRQIGETALNEMSSRSHQIIRLTVDSSARGFSGKENFSTLSATVNFVDLAGSERASQSLSAGARLKEGCHINRSLLTLGTVIRKLSKGKNGHIPFRDSKLTRILQSALGGNARTAIICTMSPARSHVEQSRNTLLFASCAKEVSTNAQVNVVMSDKALIKHLQREIARLENELRSPGSTTMGSDYGTLLQEKDLQIEKLEKDMKDLILQRDIAQAQVKDLLKVLENQDDTVVRVGVGQYPSLRVHESPDSENQINDASSLADSPIFSRHSRSSSEDNFIRVPEFDECSQQNTPPAMVSGISSFDETEYYRGWDEIVKRSNGTSEDVCKEVRCIETEDLSYSKNMDAEYNPSPVLSDPETKYPHEKERGSALTSSSSSPKEEKGQVELPSKEHESLESPPVKGNGQALSSSLKGEKDLYCVDSFNLPSVKSSLSQHGSQVSSEYGSSKLTKSKSCQERLLADMASPWFDKEENNENTSPNGFERDFVGRPDGCDMEPSALKFDLFVDEFPEKGSHPSPEYTVDIELQVTAENLSRKQSAEGFATSVSEINETAELHKEDKETHEPTKEAEQKAIQSSKNVKDVGLDPMEDEYKVLTSWPSEFKRLQREIIELWDSCNVSLAHRTYFFLLFQGDTTDAIYMEVEMRRLSFLKDTFSRGQKTTINGRTLTNASSAKALRHERRMLSKQMLKKLSEQEREGLFLKWGIGLNSKLRRLQLAHRVWTKTDDMNHIADSAYLVAKLVGFIEPGHQTPKEMFGLNFTPPSTSRGYSFKRSLVSLL